MVESQRWALVSAGSADRSHAKRRADPQAPADLNVLRFAFPLVAVAAAWPASAVTADDPNGFWPYAYFAWALTLPPLGLVLLAARRLRRPNHPWLRLGAVKSSAALGAVSGGVLFAFFIGALVDLIPVPVLVGTFAVGLVNPPKERFVAVVLLDELLLGLGIWFGTRLGRTLWVELVAGCSMLVVAMVLSRLGRRPHVTSSDVGPWAYSADLWLSRRDRQSASPVECCGERAACRSPRGTRSEGLALPGARRS